MKPSFLIGSLIAALFAINPPDALAQRGTGQATGIARQAVKPEIVTLNGQLDQIVTAPCEATTGRSPIGTHIVLVTPDGAKHNIHLGPATEVADLVGKLPVGEPVTVEAFRTDNLKPGQFIARAILVGDERLELRDASLRPVWANAGPRSTPAWGCPNRGCGYFGQGLGPRGGMGPGGGRRRGWR